ncbi:(E2-independent) E3 ubiquitin-conjugating enzyme FATS isoform X2 [Colossoma macropomum]|uniref:(E2-independent) E3 ubiquitin-conjugating enzyme FATS isoform X2 n=1 Tax=Colossoma macropomum TaxID=42526 RepID=UPI001863F72F|nr:(E2-independent) E3 ubiquitin-conjugating enzyme FATS isoform X2 [Colossoma macropomum]
MDVKSESWQRPPKLRQDGTSHLRRTPEWRRSGDESYWEGQVAQADRPPRAARPQSCIEGRLMDDWLQTLEMLQAHPVQQQVPAFVDRTASMPVLPSKMITGSLNYSSYPYFQKREWTPSMSPSPGDSSLDSLDSLDSQSGLDTQHKAQIKMAPSAQKAKLCRLAPVRIGWLPLQRHVVMTSSPNTAHHHGNTSQVKLKPPITPVLSSSSVKAPGSESGDRPAEWRGVGVSSGVQRPWRIPEHSSTQAAGSGNRAPVERDHEVAHDPASRGQMPRSQNSELQPNSLMWTTPVRRRGSVPQSSSFTDGSPPPKHSSSISSITITSRKVVRSSSLPDTSIPPQAGGRAPSPMAINSHQTDLAKYPHSQYSRQVTPRRKAVVVKVTEQRAESSRVLQACDKDNPVDTFPCHQTPGEGSSSSKLPKRRSPSPAISNLTSVENHTTPAHVSVPARDNFPPGISSVASRDSSVPSTLTTPETYQPVVLRRKATIVKVEHRESYRSEAKGRVEHRHSYTEGFRATRSVTFTSTPSYANTEPLLTNEPSLAESAQAGKSNEKVKELHRSTLSFQLSSPSSNGPPLDNSHSPVGHRPRRPASCYASMFIPPEPSANDSKDPGFQSTSSALPQKTNIDPGSSTGSSSNRRWSTGGGAWSRDEIYPGRGSSAGDVGQWQRESALLGNQQPLTLIKVPESSADATRNAVVALNAAAVIANIKWQSQQRKRAQSHSSTKGDIDPLSQRKTAERDGGDKVCNGEQGPEVDLSVESKTAACVKHWHAEFVPLQTTDKSPSNTDTLSALEQRRPDFIRHSQARVQALQKRARERRQLHSHTPTQTTMQRQRDNIFKSQDRSISGKKQQQQQFRQNYSHLPEVKRRKEEERRKLASQTNRLRAELFKKKILEQVLHRGKD